MKLEAIAEEAVPFAEIRGDAVYQAVIKRCNIPSEKKYKVNVTQDDDKVGFLTFRSEPELIFIGMMVNPDYRGRHLSHALLELLFQYADQQGLEFVSTSSQRKPLTTHLLTKYGFEAVDQRSANQVYVVGQEGDEMRICFRDRVKEQEFARSNLMKHSGQYAIEDHLPEEELESVFLCSEYILTNPSLLAARRAELSGLFAITLLDR